MKISKKFSEITSYQVDNFKEWFGNMEFEDKTSKLYSWNVSADSVEDPPGWLVGDRVFSRNSFDTEPVSHSDTLTLEKAIKVVKENGYQVSKIYV